MQQPLISLQAESEEKRSRFISLLIPATSEESVRNLLATEWKTHPKASHICWAFRLQPDSSGSESLQVQEGYSDDGEPAGTAGMPILKQLRHKNLTNCALLVIRYYGGIKLGTGGLQRAYSHSTQDVLQQLNSTNCEPIINHQRLNIFCDFAMEAHIRYLIGRYDGMVINSQYDSQGVTITAEIKEEDGRLRQDILVQAGVYIKE
ncbi:IMPACT family protein [Thalassolituus hydrocarboniclasticus]|uniref:YigZ family protein n=1 Tax=Thalassolituus hydrocarboniclasticus TaxID=2742796 RepID=A0ABY6A973_9GAMM|nr:YigZ family protein [Thalassolituus hydrocarboniclasticus]UXD87561.1 YigZ family protein [Thalassolituus hydrocarboniclasticus]